MTTTMFSSTSIHRTHHSISKLSIPKSHLPPTIFHFSKTSILKPLHLSNPAVNRTTLVCKAYEADNRSQPLDITFNDQSAQKIKIGVYFATWWALNVVFNIYNKKVLNAFPYPWLTSLLSLACGSLMMLVSWATRVAPAPAVDFEFWKSLFPVAVAHTIGHVAATVSMSKVAVSFTHIIKSGEPAFSVLVSRFLLGESFPLPVYLSLLPIIGGCSLAAVTELNFNLIGFMGAMISNMAFVFRNIFSKKGMSSSGGKKNAVSGMNYYACLSIMSLLILTPFAVAVEGPKMWAAGWRTAVAEIGPNFVWWVAAQSVFYHLYNQVSYMSLDQISPLTFSVGNTMKRISVIVSSIIIFHTPIQPVNSLGAAIAILGTFILINNPDLCSQSHPPTTSISLWLSPPISIRMEEQVRFVIEAAEAESMTKQFGLTKVEGLLPTLVRSAQSLARPPISNYQVGAVGLGSSGRIFFGANIEFPGLPLNNSIHAEQFLVTNLYLNAEPSMSSMAVSSAPCGHCRQFFQELRSSGSIRILVTDDDHRREFEDFSKFLPHRFGPDDLLHKDSPLILERHDNKLSLISDSDSEGELKMEALEAANRSHAPYSKCPSGIALMDSEGKVYRGSYMESAAFNPSLGPVQAAMVACIVGGAYERIVAAVLVEKEGALVKQEATARLILATVAPKCELQVFHCRSG